MFCERFNALRKREDTVSAKGPIGKGGGMGRTAGEIVREKKIRQERQDSKRKISPQKETNRSKLVLDLFKLTPLVKMGSASRGSRP